MKSTSVLHRWANAHNCKGLGNKGTFSFSVNDIPNNFFLVSVVCSIRSDVDLLGLPLDPLG